MPGRSIPLWSQLLVLFAALAVPTTAHSFHPVRHREMTSQVVNEDFVFPERFKQAVLLGAIGADLFDWADGYCDPAGAHWCGPATLTPAEIADEYSRRHYDNCRIWGSTGGISFVNALTSEARTALAAWNGNRSFLNTIRAWSALVGAGRAVHAVQDFYAHSNYLEFHNELYFGVDQIPLWQGDDYAGSTLIVNSAGSVSLRGLQTGYFMMTMPAGGTTHDILNKDDPTSPPSPQGVTWYYNLFSDPIWTKYRVVSGQFAGTGFGDPYTIGLASRHTYVAIRALKLGTAVYAMYPLGTKAAASPADFDILPIVNELVLDPVFADIAAEVSAALQTFDDDDLATFPYELLAPESGLPLKYTNGGFVREDTTAISFDGPQGGPLAPACRSAVLANATAGPLFWSASCSQNWIELEPSSGMIAVDGSVSMALCVSSPAELLPIGEHGDTCIVRNDDTGFSLALPIRIIVNEPTGVDGSGQTDRAADISLTVLPNPANLMTRLRVHRASSGNVTLGVYDLTGRMVCNLADAWMGTGTHEFRWDGRTTSGRAVASGTYVVRLEADGKVRTVRVSLIR